MKQESRRTTAPIIAVLAAAMTLSIFTASATAQSGQGRGAFNLDPRAEERTYHFTDTDEDLPYCVFASSKIDASKPAPLIISLHGLGADPQIMCTSTAVDLAEEGGYILAAPMGYNTSGWYGSRSGGGMTGGCSNASLTQEQRTQIDEAIKSDLESLTKKLRNAREAAVKAALAENATSASVKDKG